MKFIFLLLFPTILFSQNSEIEKLLNSIVEDEIPKQFSYFNLVDSSFIFQVRFPHFENDLKEIIYEYKIQDLDYNEFFKDRNDSILNFNNYNIEKARIYSEAKISNHFKLLRKAILIPFNYPKDKLDSLNENKDFGEVIVPVRKNWNEKKINKKVDKAWNEYEKLIKIEDKVFFYISTPLFSKNKKYSLITLKRSNGGNYLLYKKENDKWIKIADFGWWAN